MYNFSEQNVVVTGASRGIGKAISTYFLRNGAHVIGIYGSNTEAAQAFSDEVGRNGEKLTLYQCDISSQAQVEQLYRTIEEKFSSIDVLINNAGIRRDSVVAMMALDDWQRVIDVNLTGSYLMAKHAVLLMMKKKYGRIVTITSPVSHLGFAGQANYAASKAGQVAMSKSLAKETARKKITVNCVSPGFIDTDFINDLSKEQLSMYKKMVPMRRFGTVNEVAEAVLFLASPAASYITGSVLEVNGGL